MGFCVWFFVGFFWFDISYHRGVNRRKNKTLLLLLLTYTHSLFKEGKITTTPLHAYILKEGATFDGRAVIRTKSGVESVFFRAD